MLKKSLFKNAVILTTTSFLLRIMGLWLRTYMAQKLGSEGMGLYQLIISIYVLATTMVTVGLSTAVIRIISEALAQNQSSLVIKRMMQKACRISLVVSLVTTVLFYALAPIIGFMDSSLGESFCVSKRIFFSTSKSIH